ncbi:protoporphyrinogen IX oxidase [Roseivirga sp. 4D4]|uniref:CopD family protein n=1 Tax=Roseivirga sp. 4D4 TaxID=1889784 RepID=UPI0008535EDF|nr:CopD family protein [Roseivirga sp. 4D4]OEK02250.1 protoporphyrinogen IX oxidase [Roseivirga sp. 4D4]
MADLYIKSLHIIFIVTWFAGLFYGARLFIYQREALDKPEPDRTILGDQLKIMSKRLWYIIAWPSAIITLILGSTMIYQYPAMLELPFMHVKLTFVVVLYIYHFLCHKLFVQLQNDVKRFSSTQLRIWNEISTLILISVVFIIVLKNEINWIKGTLGFFLVTVSLMIGIRIYKRLRTKA